MGTGIVLIEYFDFVCYPKTKYSDSNDELLLPNSYIHGNHIFMNQNTNLLTNFRIKRIFHIFNHACNIQCPMPFKTPHGLTFKLTLQEGASGMDIKGGGAFNARHYKNPFKGPFGPIFFA